MENGISLTEIRNNLKEVFDSVYLDNDEIIIHRKGNENVVVIPFDEYSTMKKTKYLLSSKNNREHLNRSIKQLKKGKVIGKDLIE